MGWIAGETKSLEEFRDGEAGEVEETGLKCGIREGFIKGRYYRPFAI